MAQPMVTVRVVQSFRHQGRPVAAGDEIEMVPVEAAAAARRGDVSLTRATPYRRADLRADAPGRRAAKRGGGKGTYRRTDLVAE